MLNLLFNLDPLRGSTTLVQCLTFCLTFVRVNTLQDSSLLQINGSQLSQDVLDQAVYTLTYQGLSWGMEYANVLASIRLIPSFVQLHQLPSQS